MNTQYSTKLKINGHYLRSPLSMVLDLRGKSPQFASRRFSGSARVLPGGREAIATVEGIDIGPNELERFDCHAAAVNPIDGQVLFQQDLKTITLSEAPYMLTEREPALTVEAPALQSQLDQLTVHAAKFVDQMGQGLRDYVDTKANDLNATIATQGTSVLNAFNKVAKPNEELVKQRTADDTLMERVLSITKNVSAMVALSERQGQRVGTLETQNSEMRKSLDELLSKAELQKGVIEGLIKDLRQQKKG